MTDFYQELPLRNYVIVGSRALNLREADDIDVIVYKKDILLSEGEYDTSNDLIYTFELKGIRVECLLADYSESLQKILTVELSKRRVNPYVSFHTLYILKQGHISVPSQKWEKHMQDYATLRAVTRYHELSYNDYYPFHSKDEFEEVCKLHKKDTVKRLENMKSAPKLNGVDKKSFFDDTVVKFVDHDRIHEWMAFNDKPAYTQMQLPDNDVQCEKSLFENMHYSEKLKCVAEEAMVIACERKIIPFYYKSGARKDFFETLDSKYIKSAFKWALMRICTTLTSGWFREFAQNNYYSVLNLSPMDFPFKIKVEELDANYMKKLKYEKSNSN